MDKGEIIHFQELQTGDYFSDNNGRKFIRIKDRKIELPDFPIKIINAFHIQSNCMYSLDPENEFIFIRHATDGRENIEEELIHSERISEIEYQQDLFLDYSETIESFLQEEKTSDDFTDDEFHTQQEYDDFINMVRSSFFISLYSFLEAQLNNECRNFQRENGQIKISLSDIHGSGINRAKIYLEKVMDTSFPFANDENWKEILFLNILRNHIVHGEGQVNDKELLRKIEGHQFLHLDENFIEKRIILDNGFCEYVIKIVCGFLKSLEFHRQADRIQ